MARSPPPPSMPVAWRPAAVRFRLRLVRSFGRITAPHVTSPGQNERRLVERVMRHWTKAAAGKRFPRLDEIDAWVLGDDWANCLVIAVQSPVELSHFVVAGENLAVALCPRDTLAGLLLSHVPPVLSARRCLIAEGEATLRGVPILYRAALLPLSDDGTAIDHVLGAANHRRLFGGEPTTTRVVRKRWI